MDKVNEHEYKNIKKGRKIMNGKCFKGKNASFLILRNECVDINLNDEEQQVISLDYPKFNIRKTEKSFPNIKTIEIGEDVSEINIPNSLFPNVEKVYSRSRRFCDDSSVLIYRDLWKDRILKNTFCKKPEDVIEFDDILSIDDYAFTGCECLNLKQTDRGPVNCSKKAFAGSALELQPFKDGIKSAGNIIIDVDTSADEIILPASPEFANRCNDIDVSGLKTLRTHSISSLTSINASPKKVILESDSAKWKYGRFRTDILVNTLLSFGSITKIECNIPGYVIKDDILYSADMKTLIAALKSVSHHVVIPEGVCRIRKNAFNDSDIETVKIPDSVKSIEMAAFSGCLHLKSVDFGRGLTDIGGDGHRDIFRGCSSLDNVDIPETVEVIGPGVFALCTSLKRVTFHEGLKEIRKEAFFETGLTEIELPESLEKLEKYALLVSLSPYKMMTVKMKHFPQNIITALTKDSLIDGPECVRIDCEDYEKPIFIPVGMKSAYIGEYNANFNRGVKLKDSYLSNTYSSGSDYNKELMVLYRTYKYTKDSGLKDVIVKHANEFARRLATFSEDVFVDFLSLDCVEIDDVNEIIDILKDNGWTSAIAYLVKKSKNRDKKEFNI